MWNEQFKFRVDYKLPSEGDKCDANGTDTNGTTKKKEEQQKLIIKIMDRDNFTQDDFLGQATYVTYWIVMIGLINCHFQLSNYKEFEKIAGSI